MRRTLIIGAGPVGVAAAHLAVARGDEVTLVERGDVGESLRRWGPTRLYTPLAMNVPAELLPLVGAVEPQALLTGPEMAERVLVPLAARLGERVRLGTRVVSVGRARMSRAEYFGHSLRAERPFRVLVAGPRGEDALEADCVLDCSGTYATPQHAGAGGQLAVGERELGGRVLRHLGVIAERLAQLGGKRILLLGHGHSAATAIGWLARLAAEYDAEVVWAVRTPNRRPIVDVADDPLPERLAVVARANAVAESPPARVRVERRAQLESLALADDESLRVTLTGGRALTVDTICALTGYRPDYSFVDQLTLDLAPDSEGLARLSRALSTVTDCLSVPRVSAADLQTGEPDFHVLGQKSYGRARTFLLNTAIAHLREILR